MERPQPGILKSEVANPEPAGILEKVGIGALNLPWKRIGIGTTIIALTGAGALSVRGVMTFFENRQQRSGTISTQLGSEQIRPVESDYLFQGNILTKNFNPVIMYDGGIIINDVEGLAVAVVPSMMEALIKRLSWYNVPTTNRPIINVLSPISGRERYVFTGDTIKRISDYERAQRITVYQSMNTPIPVLDLLKEHAYDMGNDNYGQLNYGLTLAILRERIKIINMMNSKDSPVDISDRDKELIRLVAPLRVTYIDPVLLDKAKSNQL